MDTIEVLKALAEPTRLRVVSLLANRGPEVCVCDITSVLEQPQSTISRQLAILRQQGVVVARREGLWIHYSLAEASTTMHRAILQSLAPPAGTEPQLKDDLKHFDRLKKTGDLACCEPQSLNGQKCCAPPAPSRKEKQHA